MMLLQCQNVSKSFRIQNERITPLKEISFSVEAGEKVVINGESGAGKSLLLSLVSGLDRPSSGKIWIRGNLLSQLSSEQLTRLRRFDIGIIFQNHNLIPSWTLLENVEAALIQKLDRTTRRDLASQMLSKLGLGHRLNHLPHQASIGEQQRVAIARTLVRKPRLILADEPAGDVDPDTGMVIVNLLYQAVQDNQSGLLITTHGHFSSEMADKAYTLRDGKLQNY